FAFGSSAVRRGIRVCAEAHCDPWLSALPSRRVRLFQASVMRSEFCWLSPLPNSKSNLSAMLTNYKILHEIGEIPHGICLDSDNGDKVASQKRHELSAQIRLKRLSKHLPFDSTFPFPGDRWRSKPARRQVESAPPSSSDRKQTVRDFY